MKSFELKQVQKVYSDGLHNAFTGMAFFKGSCYLAFRNGKGHSGDAARQIIMKSTNGTDWLPLSKKTMPDPKDGDYYDYRDSYFLVDGDRLLIYSAASLFKDGKRLRFDSQVQTTTDGISWTDPEITLKNVWLWKPIKAAGKYYGGGYYYDDNKFLNVNLMSSDDGIAWKDVSRISCGGESHMYPLSSERIRVLVRTERKPYHLEVYESTLPFLKWEKVRTIPQIIQGPHVFRMKGKTFLAGRERPDYLETADPQKPSYSLHRTKIWEIMEDASIQEVIELPSSGDNAYPGTAVLPDDTLLMSYYSQHDTGKSGTWSAKMPADIFVASLKPCF